MPKKGGLSAKIHSIIQFKMLLLFDWLNSLIG